MKIERNTNEIERNTNENKTEYKLKYREIQIKYREIQMKIERNTNVVYLARPDSNSWEQRSVDRRLKKNTYVKFVKNLNF